MNQKKKLNPERCATKNCVRCLKYVHGRHSQGGYVLYGKKKVTAAWCARCEKDSFGFSGHYLPRMGLVSEYY